MSATLQFNKKLVDQVEKDFSKLKLDPTQRAVIDNFAKLYTKFIPISDMAMKGFISLTLRDFQIETHINLEKVSYEMPAAERAKAYEAMTRILTDKLSKVLQRPEQKQQLVAAIKEAMQAVARMGL